jgi:hypothetical protein
MYYRQISAKGEDFGFPYGDNYTLAFSRIVYGREVLVAYNVSNQERNDFIVIDASYHQAGDSLSFLYGDVGTVPVKRSANGTISVQIQLRSHQFVILQ